METQEDSSRQSKAGTGSNVTKHGGGREVPGRSTERKALKFRSEATSDATWDAMSANLLEASVEFWETVSDEDRSQFYDEIESFYRAILEEYRNGANAAAGEFKKIQRKNSKTRLILISLTGGLAVLNVLAAYKWPDVANANGISTNGILSLSAAIYASILAILANVESFLNYSDQKAGARETREIYLDNLRNLEALWLLKVDPFVHSPQGCYNAASAYRQLIGRDAELRRKIMSLTTIEPREK
jgi:hypothetical protein